MKAWVHSITYWDALFFSTIFKLNGKKTLTVLLPQISRSGNGHFYPLIAVLLFILRPDIAGHFLVVALVSFAVELPLYKLIKNYVKRDRPYAVISGVQNSIVPSDKFSFPSGHTAAAFVMVIVLGHFIPVLTIPMLLWALLIGFSRIYVGVHYPTDILAGMVLGASSGLIGLAITL